jgi:murein L,D-transpeptidase YcbB/YkuD
MRRDLCIRRSILVAIAACLPSASAPIRAQDAHAPPPADSRPQVAETDQTNEMVQVERQPSRAEQFENPGPNLGSETAEATFEAAKRYADIVAAGGWPRVGMSLPDSKGRAVTELRRRLAAEGYLSADEANGAAWDERLTEAVKRFQSNMGLRQTGFVSGATLNELNVPAAVRARQLAATAKRLSHLHFRFGERYVDVNIPAAAVEAVEDGQATRRYTAIVGDPRHPSPEITAKIVSIDLNPTWTVPASIVKKEVVPKLRRDPNYLSREQIRVLDGRGHEIDPRQVRWLSKPRAARFTFRQDPGVKNSLGLIRISMPNNHDVYMHDTPKKNLFARAYRFLSHGCVRVDGVYDLAAWILEGSASSPSGHWDEATLRQNADKGQAEKIRLLRPVPVVWAYMTGWASADGTVHFRRDIYGMDKQTRIRPAGKRGRVASKTPTGPRARNPSNVIAGGRRVIV